MIITVVLEALTGSFNTDIQRSARRAERDVKRMESEIRRSLSGLARTFTAGIGIGAFVASIRNLVNEADALRDFSQQVGISVETLSEYGAVAEKFGVQAESFNQALAKLNSNIAGAAAGNKKAEEGFRLLGLSAESAPGKLKPLEQVLGEVADVIAKLPPGSALAQRALEKLTGVAGLAPLFQEGAEAIEKERKAIEELGGTISGDFADKADDFNDSISDLTTGLKGIGRSIAEELIEPLSKYVKVASDAIATNRFLNSPRGLELQIQETQAQLQNLPGGPGAQGHELLTRRLADLQQRYHELRPAIELTTKAVDEQAEAGKNAAKQLEEQLLAAEKAEKNKGEIEAARKKAEAEAKKAAAEARRFQEAIAQGDAEIFQALQDREHQALEASLDLRLISYQGYLNEKLRLTEAEIDAEIAASEALLQGAAADEAAILQARIQTLEIQREIARESKTQEEAKHAQELADAYEDAARAAKSYVDEISRQGQRELLLLDLSPKDRRFAQGQFQIEDRFRGDREQLDRELSLGNIEQADYDKRLQALQGFYSQAIDEHRRYFEAIEAKQNDFTTSFNNSIAEYVDSTQSAGAVLGDTLVHALDDATHAASRAAAEFILFGESPREAIYQLARTIATDLLSSLIHVGIQALLTKTLLAGIGGGGGPATGFSDGFKGFALGGYVGDDPRNKVAGVVHGQEFVVNADATRKNRDLLESINAGTLSDAASVPRTSGQGVKSGSSIRIINVPDKTYIKDYLMGEEGDEVFTNWVGRNGSRIKQAVAS